MMDDKFYVEIQVPDVLRKDPGEMPVQTGSSRWALVGNGISDWREADILYQHMLQTGSRARLIRYGPVVVQHWKDPERQARREELEHGKSSVGCLVVHPADLAEVMANPSFVSVFRYAGAEPGEVGRYISESAGRDPVRVFVSTEASKFRPARTEVPQDTPIFQSLAAEPPTVAMNKVTVDGLLPGDPGFVESFRARSTQAAQAHG